MKRAMLGYKSAWEIDAYPKVGTEVGMWIETEDGRAINLSRAFSLEVIRGLGYMVVAYGAEITNDGSRVREIIANKKTEVEAKVVLEQVKALMLANGVLTPWSLLQAKK